MILKERTMPQHIIEGTWEEIKLHEAELTGRQVRLTIKSEARRQKSSASRTKLPAPPNTRELVGFGAFKDALPSSEDYMREKRVEIEREERNFSNAS